MKEYIFLLVASGLFSLQFLFNRNFQRKNGTGIEAVALFTVSTSFTGFLLLCAINGFHLEFTLFSFLIALIYSCVNITFNYASIKAIATVNLGVYSLFSMLGGMLLPFLYGLIFNQESITFPKILCSLLIVFATFFTVADLKNTNKKAIPYYILVFALNGAVGVLSSIHQNATVAHVDSSSFIAISKLLNVAICGSWILCRNPRLLRISIPSFFLATGYSAFNSVGNLLVMEALLVLPASVQYPMITGATMIFSAVISLLMKEKFTLRNGLCVAIALIATIFIAS